MSVLFSNWRAAADESPLPAAPLTLARFLAGNPAGAGAQQRPLGVIKAAHRENGFDPPGRTDSARELLDDRRRRWRRARAAAIALLPESGWPTAVFARRDTMILALAGAGLPGTQIAAVRAGDVREAEDRPATLRVPAGGQTLAVTLDEEASGISAGAYLAELARGPGPTGFGLARALAQAQIDCVVAAPSKLIRVSRVAHQLGYGVESVRSWVRQADIDDGYEPGVRTAESKKVKELEHEIRELKRANEILKRAVSFFVAEIDRQHKR